MTYGKSKKMEEMSPTRTAQHCAQCTAHGRISLLKGHKKVCPFKECMCVHCVLVKNKRHIMAKQVKLKRLQEKNHVRQRRMKDNKLTSSLRGPVVNQEKKLVFLDDAGINEMQHYQEEAWRAICAQTNDLDQVYLDQQGSATGEPWSPVSPVQYNHTGPRHHLYNPCTLMYPLPSSTTAMNLFSTPVSESEALNHVFTQPVYYHCLPPDCTQNVVLTPNQISDESSSESSLQPLEVASFIGGPPHTQMAAAETLLTLRTGDE